MKRTAYIHAIGAAAILTAVGVTASPVRAAISGQSDAHALRAQVQAVGGVLGINVGPIAPSAGSAPDAYANNNLLAFVNASAAGVAQLSTGVLTSQATSNIASGSTAGQAFATSQVDGLSLEIVPGIIITPDLVNLSADTIGSNAQVSFDGSNVLTQGGIVIEDLTLSVAGIGNILVDANAAPNTVLLDLLGIRIVLNEQIVTTMGDTTTLEVNAIHITINSVLQAVGADVIIAHSEASVTIPTPAGLIPLGCTLLGFASRRRR